MVSLETENKSTSGKLSSEIYRVAIDSTGRVGSLYDGYRDCIIHPRLKFRKIEETFNMIQSRKCEFFDGQYNHDANILKIMKVEEELRLSILLNMFKKTGVGIIPDYYQPTNEYTRFIRCSCVYREEKLPDHPSKIEIIDSPPILVNTATHIITKVDFGIQLTIVLQLPTVLDTVLAIDKVLETLCSRLQNQQSAYLLTTYEKSVLEKILQTKVYSNIPHFANLSKLWDVCSLLQQNQRYFGEYPISYSLRPIIELLPDYFGNNTHFSILSAVVNETIENYVFQLTISMKNIENSITRHMPKSLSDHLKRHFNNIESEWSDVKKKFTNEIQRMANLVIQLRSSKAENSLVHDKISTNEQMKMLASITNLTQHLKHLERKENFIRQLNQRRFQYMNADKYKIDKTDNNKTIGQKLSEDHQYYRILCSNDCLNLGHPNELEKLIFDLTEQQKHNPNLCLIYADFSDSSFLLTNMFVLQSPKSHLE